MLNIYFDINFDVLHAATGNRYANGNDIRVVNPGPIALFSNYKLTTSSGKHLEEINNAHIIPLMYKLTTSARDTDELSIGFDRSRDRRKLQLTDNKSQEGKFQLRIFLRVVFGFAEHQEKCIFGLGYRLI